MAFGDSSSQLPVVPAGMTSQGTVNWDSVISRSLSFSVGILNRCANAGVDPYSIVVAQAIAQSFPLAQCGRDNIQSAVTSLEYQNSIHNTLRLGFGVSSFVRTLALTDQGTSLLGICSALSECFHGDMAAEVMFHIVKAYHAPGELTPSTGQWAMIIRACSGVLARSKFPILAEGLMRLDPASVRVTRPNNTLQEFPYLRGIPIPEDLAKVIIGAGKVASGELQSIHVAGCAAAGWIAAICEWLFGLNIVIYSSPLDQVPAYSNCGIGDEVHVFVTFKSGDLTSRRESLSLAKKTYLLPDSSMFMTMEQTSYSETRLLLGGRVPWESCLTDAFGGDFQRLLKVPLNFGTAIGCAARMFKAIAKAEAHVPAKYLEDCRSYFDSALGQGFVHHAGARFPELSPLKAAMEKASRMSFEESKQTYEEKVAAIERLCNCSVCADWNSSGESEGFCLVIVLEAIITLCQTTAGMTVMEGMQPRRSGIEYFYKRQLSGHFQAEEGGEDDGGNSLGEAIREMGPFGFVLWTNNFMDMGIGEESQPQESLLVNSIRLFTGHETTVPNKATSAVSDSGVCAADSTGRVNVVPGAIEHDHKPFRQVQDNELDLMRRTGSITSLESRLTRLTDHVLEVTETARSLSVNFIFRSGEDTGDGLYMRLGPADIVDRAHKARGLVPCAATLASCRKRRATSISRVDRSEYPIIRVEANGEEVVICDTSGGGVLPGLALRVAKAQDLQ